MEVGVIMNLEYLNDRQKEAVLYGDGPLLILAGAGSGKTSVLTKRVAYLIKERNVSPKNIVAIITPIIPSVILLNFGINITNDVNENPIMA